MAEIKDAWFDIVNLTPKDDHVISMIMEYHNKAFITIPDKNVKDYKALMLALTKNDSQSCTPPRVKDLLLLNVKYYGMRNFDSERFKANDFLWSEFDVRKFIIAYNDNIDFVNESDCFIDYDVKYYAHNVGNIWFTKYGDDMIINTAISTYFNWLIEKTTHKKIFNFTSLCKALKICDSEGNPPPTRW